MSERSTLREYLEALLIAGLFLSFSNTFVFKTFFIPSGSMEETLLIGDHLLVNRFVFGGGSELEQGLLPLRDVRRGDIVVFRSPEDPRIDMVKRCVGVPGDRIEVRNKQLFVNGVAVDDDGVTRHVDPFHVGRPRDEFGPVVVPADSYFCMGDNRDNSNDSRFWGPLPRSLIKGRPWLVYWSYAGETSDGVWRGWGNKLSQLARTAIGFFPNTRWGRMFHIVR